MNKFILLSIIIIYLPMFSQTGSYSSITESTKIDRKGIHSKPNLAEKYVIPQNSLSYLLTNNKRIKASKPSSEGCVELLDIEKGTLDGLQPSATPQQVKKKFPCFTGESEEGGDYNCGGGVFFIKHDFYFYTHRNYIEVRTNFAGKTSVDLLGISKSKVKETLGKPDKILESPYENSVASYYLYDKKYGTLAIGFEGDFCTELFVSSEKKKDVIICW